MAKIKQKPGLLIGSFTFKINVYDTNTWVQSEYLIVIDLQ